MQKVIYVYDRQIIGCRNTEHEKFPNSGYSYTILLPPTIHALMISM